MLKTRMLSQPILTLHRLHHMELHHSLMVPLPKVMAIAIPSTRPHTKLSLSLSSMRRRRSRLARSWQRVGKRPKSKFPSGRRRPLRKLKTCSTKRRNQSTSTMKHQLIMLLPMVHKLTRLHCQCP